MILVDVNVPAADMTYDFQLDENSLISDMAEEIAEMVSAYQQKNLDKQNSTPMLCSYESRQVLEGSRTLSEYGIKTGSKLLFV